MNEPFKLFVRNSKYIDILSYASWDSVFREMEYLELTGLDGVMTQYTGLSPSAAVVYTANIASQNGSVFQSSRLNTRNIVLTFTLLSNIEDNRRIIYKYFSTGEKVTLYYYGTRDVWIDGYVETMNVNQFAETPHKQVIQVSILCPDPLLKSIEDISFTNLSGGQDHVINYGGEHAYGLKVKMVFSGNTTNPYIYNRQDEPLEDGLVRVMGSFTANDTLEICTIQGQRSVVKTTTSGGSSAKYNMITDLDLPIKWTRIHPDYNVIRISADENGSRITADVTIVDVYGGV